MEGNIEVSKETKDLIASANAMTFDDEGVLLKGNFGTRRIPFQESAKLAGQFLGRQYEVGGIAEVAKGFEWAHEYYGKTLPRYSNRKTEDNYQKRN